MRRVAAAILMLAACGPSYGTSRDVTMPDGRTVRVSAVPARPPACDVDVLTPSSASAGYLTIGTIWHVGGDADDPEVQANVRRRVCELGGDAVLLVHRTRRRHAGTTIYHVLARVLSG